MKIRETDQYFVWLKSRNNLRKNLIFCTLFGLSPNSCFYQYINFSKCNFLGAYHFIVVVDDVLFFPPGITVTLFNIQVTDKLFDDINWCIVHSLKAVQVPSVLYSFCLVYHCDNRVTLKIGHQSWRLATVSTTFLTVIL